MKIFRAFYKRRQRSEFAKSEFVGRDTRTNQEACTGQNSSLIDKTAPQRIASKANKRRNFSMRSAALLRQQIESSLADRIPAAISVRFHHAPELIPTGIAEVDALLQGGLPLGGLAEIIGPACSGRSTLVSSILAGATRQGAACAYVDVADAFDPLSAAAIGINLGHLLWVRAGRTQKSDRQSWASLDQALRATDLLLNAGGFRVIVLDMGDVRDEQVRRVPLASWYRFRLQAENSQALFLLLAQTPCANSCASVVLHCKEADERWDYATGNQNGVPLLTGFQYSVRADRKRASARALVHSFSKKPVSAVQTAWKRTTLTTPWAG
jgi:hypothetical protein